jgi:hypothetical protein
VDQDGLPLLSVEWQSVVKRALAFLTAVSITVGCASGPSVVDLEESRRCVAIGGVTRYSENGTYQGCVNQP